MLEIKHITKRYMDNSRKGSVPVLEDFSLTIGDGETVALTGESGSGKSTLARLICGFEKPTVGSIRWNGEDVFPLARRRTLYRHIQPVFQDSLNCFDPRQKIKKSLCEPLQHFCRFSEKECMARLAPLLDTADIPAYLLEKYPHELSGGQQKRICIIRALSIRPKLVVLDEAVAGLDPTVMLHILQLLKRLQKETQCAYLFITHDLRAAAFMTGDKGKIIRFNIGTDGGGST